MHVTGITLGWIIVGGYLFSVLNFFVKFINRKYVVRLSPDSPFRKKYLKFMRAVVKGHIYVPLFLVTVILLHLMVELMHEGLFPTGVIVFCLMAAQIALGAYGAFFRDRRQGRWLEAHRIMAVVLFCAIAVHVASVIILKP